MSTKHRLIATLLVNDSVVVQTRKFKRTNMVGSAFTAVDFFNGWAVDEIMVLEISHTLEHVEAFIQIVEELSRRCFVPLTVGGKISDISLVNRYTRAGADKVVVNTHAVRNPALVSEIARQFGSQCCVVSIDAKPSGAHPSGYRVMIGNGQEPTDLDVLEWARAVVGHGAGEIMVNNLEHDGDKRGYDLALVRLLADSVDVPVIAMGGVGEWSHFADGIRLGHADAVAAGNIFHYSEHSTKKAKEFLEREGLRVRHSEFYKVNMPRRVKYKPFSQVS
jgi:cyclase